MITFLLGYFGYYDKKIMSKVSTSNLLYLPYLFGYSLYCEKKINFPYWGIYVFTGSQGSGKTLSLVKFAYDLTQKYSDVPVKSNLSLKFSQHCESWEDIYYFKGDKSIWCIDELGLWANSKKTAKDFNEVLLYLSCQNRKNHRLILTTCQQVYQVNKDIRCNSVYIIETRTIFNILTINYYYEPVVDNDGNIKQGLPRKVKFFLHTPALYKLYDSWEEISILGGVK